MLSFCHLALISYRNICKLTDTILTQEPKDAFHDHLYEYVSLGDECAKIIMMITVSTSSTVNIIVLDHRYPHERHNFSHKP
jgi:hypothetical protein